MNVETNFEQDNQYQAQEYQPASSGGGGGKFLKYGCGCLGIMLLLCGIGGVVFYTMFGDQIAAAAKMGMEYQGCIAEVQSNEAISEKLGTPINPDIFAQPVQEMNGEAMSMTYDTPIEGPDGSGTMHVKFTLNGGDVTRDEFWVEIDGEKIDMEAEGGFGLDIDDGGDGVIDEAGSGDAGEIGDLIDESGQ